MTLRRVWVWKRRWWWTACNPDEPCGEFDGATYYRSRTREGAIAKCRRDYEPHGHGPFVEEVVLSPIKEKESSDVSERLL